MKISENTIERNSGKVSFPKRYLLALMIFLGLCMLYGLRVNINIAIGAMCGNYTVDENGFKVTKKGEFNWDSKTQGIVLASFYYGYFVLQIPGGWMAQKFGGTRIFGAAIAIASFLTFLTPLAARHDVNTLIVLRVLEGLVLGVLFPCNHAIWSNWAPPLERSRLFTLTVAGCPVGTIITMPLSGLLSKYGFDGGWSSVFYVFGSLGILWSVVWFSVVHNSPKEHPTITSEELQLIECSINESEANKKAIPVPWLKIFSCSAVWACAVANFCADWGLYTILICIPKYFMDILKFDIAKAGFVAALPYILKAIVGPLSGYLADWLISRNVSIKNTRRIIFLIGCSVAGTFIVGVGYSDNTIVAITLLVIGVGITGINSTAYAVHILDFAPAFAGPIMGFSNVLGALPGFISPQLVGIITQNQTADEWRLVFWITALVYGFGIVFFCTFLAGEKQEWAKVDDMSLIKNQKS